MSKNDHSWVGYDWILMLCIWCLLFFVVNFREVKEEVKKESMVLQNN